MLLLLWWLLLLLLLGWLLLPSCCCIPGWPGCCCCCGSGRTLLQTAQQTRRLRFSTAQACDQQPRNKLVGCRSCSCHSDMPCRTSCKLLWPLHTHVHSAADGVVEQYTCHQGMGRHSVILWPLKPRVTPTPCSARTHLGAHELLGLDPFRHFGLGVVVVPAAIRSGVLRPITSCCCCCYRRHARRRPCCWHGCMRRHGPWGVHPWWRPAIGRHPHGHTCTAQGTDACQFACRCRQYACRDCALASTQSGQMAGVAGTGTNCMWRLAVRYRRGAPEC